MKSLILVLFVAACQALTPPHITGTTPPPIYCPNDLCKGKYDGNYQYYYDGKYNYNHFVQCVYGEAHCQACWPFHLQFSKGCNQCLYSYHDDCVTTKPWTPATTFYCPDICYNKGPYYSGNIEDPQNSHHYVACWEGVTVGCVACPSGLKFNEKWNACLYDGVYKTKPDDSSNGFPTTHGPHHTTHGPHHTTGGGPS